MAVEGLTVCAPDKGRCPGKADDRKAALGNKFGLQLSGARDVYLTWKNFNALRQGGDGVLNWRIFVEAPN